MNELHNFYRDYREFSVSEGNQRLDINLSDQPSGFYFIELYEDGIPVAKTMVMLTR